MSQPSEVVSAYYYFIHNAHSCFSFLNLGIVTCSLTSPYFLKKRIEIHYLKYLKAILETVGYFLPIVSSIMLKYAFMWMNNLNLIKTVKHLKTLVNVDLKYLVVLYRTPFLKIAGFSG